MNHTEAAELLRLEEILRRALDAYVTEQENRKERRAKISMEEKLLKYKLYIANKNAETFRKKISGKTEISSPTFKREHKRRIEAIADAEARKKSIELDIIAAMKNMGVASGLDRLEELNHALGREKIKLGARNYSLSKFEQRHGLNNTGLLNDSKLVEPSTYEQKQMEIDKINIPSEFDFLLSETFAKTREKVSTNADLKISTEFSLDDLKMP